MIAPALFFRGYKDKSKLFRVLVFNDHRCLVQADIDELYEIVALAYAGHCYLVFGNSDYRAQVFIVIRCLLFLKMLLFLFLINFDQFPAGRNHDFAGDECKVHRY